MKREHSIDVILTAYKRPELLWEQLEAVKNQSVKPANIFLYQDGTGSFYEIMFGGEFLRKFDKYCISPSNCGVWQRFEYARAVSVSEYVCVFDDDTIPGRKWLENCCSCMEQERAVYGTNGVLIKNFQRYPQAASMVNVGWKNPNESVTEVDFAGHSWFIERAWLEDMLDTDFKNKYKYVGEDMYLSYICQKNGIRTLIPPHPYGTPELWGSQAQYGNQYGVGRVAVSANSQNHTAMNQAIRELRGRGWRFVADIDKGQVERAERAYEAHDSQLRERITQDITAILSENIPIYLYGAGLYGQYFLEYLRRRGRNAAAFVVTRTEGNLTEMQGVPVISVERLLQEKMGAGIIMLSLNELYHQEIRKQLERRSDFRIYPAVERNYQYEEIVELIKREIM